MNLRSFVALLCATGLFASPALADEGMWLFEDFPSEELQRRHGFKPTAEWLDRVRLASVKVGGCSASFVSPDGLVMTNHHCVHRQVQQLSTPKADYVTQGFYAKTPAAERKLPAGEAGFVQEITDVTAQIHAATKGLEGAAFGEKLNAEMAALEKACAQTPKTRCEVVSLFHGGKYHLYKYRKFDDVRLVFVPEVASAAFGGDVDNYEFPRYDLDAAFVRLYDDGKPFKSAHYFKWSQSGAAENELVFVSGNPGQTSRLLTAAQLDFQRQVHFPRILLYFAELRGLITAYQERGPEQKRVSTSLLYQVENLLKRYRGYFEALGGTDFIAKKAEAERAMRAKIAADPQLKAKYGDPWAELEAATAALRPLARDYTYLEYLNPFSAPTAWTGLSSGYGFQGQLFDYARLLVRAAEERPRPNAKRLREYTDAMLPTLESHLLSSAPISKALDIERLTFGLTQLRAALGSTHPLVRKYFGKKSPRQLARELIFGTRLDNLATRKALYEGGKAKVDASKDPLLRFAALVDPDARKVRREFETSVDSVFRRAGSRVARATAELGGALRAPDATRTLRLNFGRVRGLVTPEGTEVPPFTTFEGAFAHHTGEEPFALPPSWLKARSRVDPKTGVNLISDNDIIGGNSGSPLINRDAEIVGLIFDGNIYSLSGEFFFDPTRARAVSVHSAGLLEALDRIYGAKPLVEELRSGR